MFLERALDWPYACGRCGLYKVHEFRLTIIDIQAEVKHRKTEKEAKGVYRKGLRSRMCGYLDILGGRSQGCEDNEQKGILGTAFKH